MFQAKDTEKPWVCSKLSNKTAGAEGRARVGEGEGVRRPGQVAGWDTSIQPL